MRMLPGDIYYESQGELFLVPNPTNPTFVSIRYGSMEALIKPGRSSDSTAQERYVFYASHWEQVRSMSSEHPTGGGATPQQVFDAACGALIRLHNGEDLSHDERGCITDAQEELDLFVGQLPVVNEHTDVSNFPTE